MRWLAIICLLFVTLCLLQATAQKTDKPPSKPTEGALQDFTKTDLKKLGIESVQAKKDPRTGFVVAGKNPTALIRSLKEINGRSIADLEKDMRPGALSRAGFLGANEKLLDILVADNQQVVDEWGLTHQELARHLHVLGALGIQFRLDRSDKPFMYHARKFRVEGHAYRGVQESPFQDGTKTNCDAIVHNLDNGKKLTYSLLVPHMIERYGFYEGKGTPYRVDPRNVLDVLDFLKPPAKVLKFPEWWDPKDPLPVVKSNCVRCHLTAGRELTAPLRDLARSVHDRAGLSCHDCHGGNTKDDATAHDPDHDFIGTKLSSHMAACTDCHRTETEGFRKGRHFWDLTKSINRKYPVCVDCHGNHDVGKPPPEFALTNVCTDCHKDFAKTMPGPAAVVAGNDELWKTLRQVHAKNKDGTDPTPESFRQELKRIRTSTSLMIHRASPIAEKEAQALNERVQGLRERLEKWLKQQP